MKHFLYEKCGLAVLWSDATVSVYQHVLTGRVFRITGDHLGRRSLVINAYHWTLDDNFFPKLSRNRKEITRAQCEGATSVASIVAETISYMLAEMGPG